jgi:hypothetical protein
MNKGAFMLRSSRIFYLPASFITYIKIIYKIFYGSTAKG